MTDVMLTAEEWSKAMNVVLASKVDEDENKESKKGKKPAPRRRAPYTLPAAKAGLNYGDAGDTWSAKQPPVGEDKDYMDQEPEPTPGQGVDPVAHTLAPTTTPDIWDPKVGKPQSTGKPTGSMALNETDTQAGWSSNVGKPEGTVYNSGNTPKRIWTAFPQGTNKQANDVTPDGPTKIDHLNRAPRSTMASVEDLYTTPTGNAAMPDGSFMITNADDVHDSVNKVQNAEQQNPRRNTHPWYTDLKAHIAHRAGVLGCSNLVPPDWQLSMGMKAEAELAKNYNTPQRKAMAKSGNALPDGSYPIANASDLQNAAVLARSGHGDVKAAKAHIRKRAKALGVAVPAGI